MNQSYKISHDYPYAITIGPGTVSDLSAWPQLWQPQWGQWQQQLGQALGPEALARLYANDELYANDKQEPSWPGCTHEVTHETDFYTHTAHLRHGRYEGSISLPELYDFDQYERLRLFCIWHEAACRQADMARAQEIVDAPRRGGVDDFSALAPVRRAEAPESNWGRSPAAPASPPIPQARPTVSPAGVVTVSSTLDSAA